MVGGSCSSPSSTPACNGAQISPNARGGGAAPIRRRHSVMTGLGKVLILRPARSSGVFTGFLASTLRAPKLYAHEMIRIFAPLSRASSIGLAAPASKAFVCCGKLENRYPRSKVPTRGTRLAEIGEADT